MEYTCIDCNKVQLLSDKEREFYISKGWELPKRCKSCREKKKSRFNDDVNSEWWAKPTWMR